MAGILEMIQTNDMLILLLVLVGVFFFVKLYYKEGLENTEETAQAQPVEFEQAVKNGEELGVASNQPAVPETPAPEAPVVQGLADEDKAEVTQPAAAEAGKMLDGAQLTAEDLLPKYDDANEFAKENPVSKLLQEQNFLQAGYHIGINTVVQSNKIPYLDIRSAPPIPKEQVGPWYNSSFERPAGFGRKFLEIGS